MEELKKFLNPLLFVIVIICFFLPFFNITCQEQKVASISGFELITGTTISTNGPNKGISGISVQQTEIDNALKKDSVSSEPLAVIAFLFAVGGLILSLFKKFSGIGSAIAGLLGGFSLILLSSVISENILGKIQYQPLAVECGNGFYLAVLFFFILLLYNAYLFFHKEKYKPVEDYSFDVSMTFCPHCGAENDTAGIYCNKCGGVMEQNLV
jgi:hypothetical protein